MAANDSLTGHDTGFDRLVLQEELLLQVTEALTQALEDGGVKKAELARRLGKTPGFVSQVFGGGRNLTLRTVADIAGALSLRPTLELSPQHKSLRESVFQPDQQVLRWDQDAWSRRPTQTVSGPSQATWIQQQAALSAAA
jgi:transcriptional regulator with XRE-family HTH domain